MIYDRNFGSRMQGNTATLFTRSSATSTAPRCTIQHYLRTQPFIRLNTETLVLSFRAKVDVYASATNWAKPTSGSSTNRQRIYPYSIIPQEGDDAVQIARVSKSSPWYAIESGSAYEFTGNKSAFLWYTGSPKFLIRYYEGPNETGSAHNAFDYQLQSKTDRIYNVVYGGSYTSNNFYNAASNSTSATIENVKSASVNYTTTPAKQIASILGYFITTTINCYKDGVSTGTVKTGYPLYDYQYSTADGICSGLTDLYTADEYRLEGLYYDENFTQKLTFPCSLVDDDYAEPGALTLYANYVPAGPTVRTKVSGSWVEGSPRVKVNGTWCEVSEGYVKINGVWQPLA